MQNGRIDVATARKITESDFFEWTKKALPQENDVILSRRCNPGETAFVDSKLKCALGQNLVLLRADGELVYPPFLRWLVRSPHWWNQVGTFINVGAVFDSLRCADVPKFRLPIPPLPEQKAIASILGALDDKIELNRRMNETLEAMARALFKSWFVDFDPVRAKMDGRQPPGMSADVAALFPDKLVHVNGELVPEGWKVGRLGDLCRINSNTVRANEVSGMIEYVDIASVSEGRSSGPTAMDFNSAPSRARRKISHGDTIWSCVRPNRRSFLFVHSPPENRIASTGFAVISPNLLTPCYLHYAITTHEFTSYLTNCADGSAYPAVRPDHFSDAELLEPDLQTIEAFDEVVWSFRNQIAVNEGASNILAELRDALLPKLLSGELRVADAEKFIDKQLA
ncbi:putative specificity protein s [Blastopirellula marina DSM 3645]|uniref:Putative specificity protein s n=2 Tax=Blastopirellula marina TaxID=124 RepID=A3ZXK3_9BACT|nr:putative specificity protein s [Blastopirellula marina DSM 3645]